jgi:Uma2 family endonuclease
MPAATGLMTVEEFASLPEPTDGTYLELHYGEVVRLTFPKREHNDLQHRLYELLKPIAKGLGQVRIELAFRAKPEYDLRAADIAFISNERYRAIRPTEYLMGAPDLVIEVASPSNTWTELEEKKELCLANGCREFWIVEPKFRSVQVSTRETVKRYKDGDSIPLSLFPAQGVAVSEIFEGLDTNSR